MNEDRREAAITTIDFWKNSDFFIQSDIPAARDVSKNNTRDRIDIQFFSDKFTSFESYIYYESCGYPKYPCMSSHALFWIGSVRKAEYFRLLKEELGISDDLTLDDREKSGRIAFCSFRADINGGCITDLRVSPLLWAAEFRRKRSSSDINENYEDHISELRGGFNEYCGSLAELVEGRNVDDVAEDLYKKLREELGADMYAGDGSIPEPVITHIYTRYSTEECKKDDNAANRYFGDTDFFSSDLGLVRNSIEKGYFGDKNEYEKRVVDYILAGQEKETIPERVAIQPDTDDKDSVRALFGKVFDISRFPLGKWPSGNSPVLMQQAAVNIASSDMAPPIFTVNGPPGSGKTTMLKEIVADRMVKRAMILSEIISEAHRKNTDTDSILFRKKRAGDGTVFYTINRKYFEINRLGLVAAAVSNNAAENISKEFPAMTEELVLLSKQYGDYFGKLACELFEKEEGDCFGLLSVPLAKQSNVTRFVSSVLDKLYDDTDGNESAVPLNEINAEFSERLAHLRKLTKNRVGLLDESFFDRYFSCKRSEREKAECTVFDLIFRDESGEIGFDEEREKLFYLACVLHRELVRGSECLRTNYGLLSYIWRRDDPDEDVKRAALAEECLRDILPTLFLLTPLISATFASFGSFMKNIRSGTLGTLIVDEAGQAPPMLALGALYRCSSAVIVGDPKQIPPIYISDTVNWAFARRFDVPTVFTAAGGSVQTFADSLDPYGKYLGKGENDREWVGWPLTVHRRCDDPMFSIANELSYDSSLIRRTPSRPRGKDTFVLRGSYWINVPEKKSYIRTANYYMDNQGRAVLRLLSAAFAKRRGKIPDLFVISPFSTAANGVSELIRGSEFYKNIPAMREWYKENRIGTVHTFQGREADEVIIILGCSSKSAAVTDFVTKNIMNTAVTRAKRRLYIVGDINVWEKNSSVKTAFDIMTDSGRNDRYIDEDGLNRLLTAADRGICPKCGKKLVEAVSASGSYVTCAEKECENYWKSLLPLSFGRLQ